MGCSGSTGKVQAKVEEPSRRSIAERTTTMRKSMSKSMSRRSSFAKEVSRKTVANLGAVLDSLFADGGESATPEWMERRAPKAHNYDTRTAMNAIQNDVGHERGRAAKGKPGMAQAQVALGV